MSRHTSLPDILGLLSGERLTIDGVVQCALSVFPRVTVVDQPVEALLLLQNLTDQALAVHVGVRFPTRDPAGNLMNFFTPRPRMTITLPVAETGLMHIPLTVQPPTHPGSDLLVVVRVEADVPAHFTRVRAVDAGPPPALVTLSPFRVAALRDTGFTAQAHARDARQLVATFDLLSGTFPSRRDEPLKPRYEPLWRPDDLKTQHDIVREMCAEAQRFSRSWNRGQFVPALLARTEELFAAADLPLHPGETRLMVKPLIYVLEDGLELEPGYELTSGAWFERLCWIMSERAGTLDDVDRVIELLYTAIVQDAVLVGFTMVGAETHVDFGDAAEREAYLGRMVSALEGGAPLALEHVYVPLVMAGTMLTPTVTLRDENPWQSLARIREARDGRIALVGSSFGEVFDILEGLVGKAEQRLREMRIPRP